MLKVHHLYPISVPRIHWVVRAGMGELPWTCIEEGKLGGHNLSTSTCVLSWEKLVSLLGRVRKKDVPGEVQSCEAPSHHPYSRPLRRVITSNLVS